MPIIGVFDWNQFTAAFEPSLAPMCKQVSVSLSHSFEDFSASYGVAANETPQIAWTGIPEAPAPSAPVPTLSFNYASTSSDSSEDALHLHTVESTLSAFVSGTISGDATSTQMTLYLVVRLDFSHITVGGTFGFSTDIVLMTGTVQYTLSESQLWEVDGDIDITNSGSDPDYSVSDNTPGFPDMRPIVADLQAAFNLPQVMTDAFQAFTNAA